MYYFLNLTWVPMSPMMHSERSVKDKRKHKWQVNIFMGVIIEKKGQRCVVSSDFRLKSFTQKVSLRFTREQDESWKEVGLKILDKTTKTCFTTTGFLWYTKLKVAQNSKLHTALNCTNLKQCNVKILQRWFRSTPLSKSISRIFVWPVYQITQLL